MVAEIWEWSIGGIIMTENWHAWRKMCSTATYKTLHVVNLTTKNTICMGLRSNLGFCSKRPVTCHLNKLSNPPQHTCPSSSLKLHPGNLTSTDLNVPLVIAHYVELLNYQFCYYREVFFNGVWEMQIGHRRPSLGSNDVC